MIAQSWAQIRPRSTQCGACWTPLRPPSPQRMTLPLRPTWTRPARSGPSGPEEKQRVFRDLPSLCAHTKERIEPSHTTPIKQLRCSWAGRLPLGRAAQRQTEHLTCLATKLTTSSGDPPPPAQMLYSESAATSCVSSPHHSFLSFRAY